MFDDWRRSRAIERIASMLFHGVLNKEIFSEFSEETQKRASRLIET